jgi:Adaptor complexes medium subunit family
MLPRPSARVTSIVNDTCGQEFVRSHMLYWMQVFLDIVEEVNVLLNSRGEVLSSHVVGRLVMKALLTGMPDIKIGLNDKVEVREDTREALRCWNLGKCWR